MGSLLPPFVSVRFVPLQHARGDVGVCEHVVLFGGSRWFCGAGVLEFRRERDICWRHFERVPESELGLCCYNINNCVVTVAFILRQDGALILCMVP